MVNRVDPIYPLTHTICEMDPLTWSHLEHIPYWVIRHSLSPWATGLAKVLLVVENPTLGISVSPTKVGLFSLAGWQTSRIINMPLYGCVFSLEAGAILRLDVYLCWKVIHSAAAIVNGTWWEKAHTVWPMHNLYPCHHSQGLVAIALLWPREEAGWLPRVKSFYPCTRWLSPLLWILPSDFQVSSKSHESLSSTSRLQHLGPEYQVVSCKFSVSASGRPWVKKGMACMMRWRVWKVRCGQTTPPWSWARPLQDWWL